ncbi:cellulase family glycosylhydrolase [Azospirillum brasilense]|uniref:glycoside hydrolase family 5 protein n=1 Tax=Azospirillum brasilense TaxID=192 RepID=UPI001909E24E|nr:glycoside hydrolase family 5 protein [Azospirillum brasilense]MBK3737192.1 cellulase family glycosylhydrolase [Azospirillum brasilense]
MGIAKGFLHTDGNQIVDSSGQNVKLTGVNWFGGEGFVFNPNGMDMRGYWGMMEQMKEMGFNTIRLPWSDAALDADRATGIDTSKNPDLANKSPLEVMDKVIDYAGRIGMKVILDHHRSSDGASANENGLWYDDKYPESKMIENWKMLAERYKGNDTVVGADLHNEPHGQATWGGGDKATDWAWAAERIGNEIQSVNKDWLLLVEGVEIHENQWEWWGGNLRGAKDRPIEFDNPGKLVYSVHSYGPSIHEMEWFKASDYPNNLPGQYTDNWGWLLKDDKAPVLVGEFGGKLETDQDKAYMAKLIDYMNGDLDGNGTNDLGAGKEGASWTYWSWNPNSGDTGGILKDDWQTVDQTKYNAIKEGLFDGGGSPAKAAWAPAKAQALGEGDINVLSHTVAQPQAADHSTAALVDAALAAQTVALPPVDAAHDPSALHHDPLDVHTGA